jgi:hypothetical protein
MAKFLESVKNKAKESPLLQVVGGSLVLVVFIMIIAALVDGCSEGAIYGTSLFLP